MPTAPHLCGSSAKSSPQILGLCDPRNAEAASRVTQKFVSARSCPSTERESAGRFWRCKIYYTRAQDFQLSSGRNRQISTCGRFSALVDKFSLTNLFQSRERL